MLDGFEHGDKVKVITDSEELVGTHLPRPGMLGNNIFVLKLESGYNIGIDTKNIKKVELIEKYKKIDPKLNPVKNRQGLKNISVVSSGGTISSKIDYKTGGTKADYTAEDFLEMAPELENIANLKAVKSLNIMSEDMNEESWIKIAKDIEKELNNGADGVVFTMGTDTLHYAAAALSFFFHDVKKPIIITAAQRSIDRGSSDAFMNLICSVNAAANFDGAGVFVCMHGTSNDDYCDLIRGTKVRKMHTSRRDAFRPVNSRSVARVYMDKKINILDNDYVKKDLNNKTKAHTHFDDKVGLLQITPLIDPKLIDFYIKEKYRGLIIAATALGHVPTEGKNEFLSALKKAKDAGIFTVITSQTLYGSTHPLVYTNLRKLSIGLNLLFAKDMMPETALIKLGWILGQTKDEKKIREMFENNYCYEYNDKIGEDEFLN
jgi:glutamyl-tRNA(Gln) amidotransferase subunit D